MEVGYVHLLLGAVSCRGQKVAFDLLELELKVILNQTQEAQKVLITSELSLYPLFHPLLKN